MWWKYHDLTPVTTSFPDVNKSAVHCGSDNRIVAAANLRLSYDVHGITLQIMSCIP